MGGRKSSSEREAHDRTVLPQETRETRTRQPYFTPKTTADKRKAPQLVEGRKSQRPKQK